jgi:hypothetical protein
MITQHDIQEIIRADQAAQMREPDPEKVARFRAARERRRIDQQQKNEKNRLEKGLLFDLPQPKTI